MKVKSLITTLLIVTLNLVSFSQIINADLVELSFYGDGSPKELTRTESGFYYVAEPNVTLGTELWYSDGTQSGSYMIKNINSYNNGDSNPKDLTVVNGNLIFFTANDGINGRELWKSDGTAEGTIMVKDIKINNDSDNGPINLFAFNNEIYFAADDEINGYELWKSDGTPEGTLMVKNINNLELDSLPYTFFKFNNELFFRALSEYGFELWKTDGTENGTVLLKDINLNGSGVQGLNKFLTIGNHFYFIANDGIHGSELWKSDGTENGTTMLKDLKPGNNSTPYELNGIVLNDEIIFVAGGGFGPREFWKTDGTEEGTIKINTVTSDLTAFSYTTRFATLNNHVYFTAENTINGTEIWKTDGTDSGTVLLKDINEGSASSSVFQLFADHINNKLLFFAKSTSSPNYKTLWASDGTETGTIEISSINDSNTSGLDTRFMIYDNQTIIVGVDNEYGNELWITDGTASGTDIFIDTNHSFGSNPIKFTNINGELFFKANNLGNGYQLFKSNGTVDGTQIVKRYNSGAYSIDESSLMSNLNGVLYFSASSVNYGHELWRSDGTEEGTYMVKDINPGSQSSMMNSDGIQSFTPIGNFLYFFANDGTNGRELWRSDGTEEGTYMIKNINSGNEHSHSHPGNFVLLNDNIYFSCFDGTSTGLWTTNGTEEGTVKIIDLNYLNIIKSINNKLLIVSNTSNSSYGPHDLWVSDGTAAGTNLLQSFGDGDDSFINYTTVLNDELYFVAKSPDSFRKAIYKTDGTASGTTILFDAANHLTMPDLDIDHIYSCGNYVYFLTQDSFNFVREIWRTDGVNTEQITSSNENALNYIQNLTCYKNNLLYLAESLPNNIITVTDNSNEAIILNINTPNENHSYIENVSIKDMGVTENNLFFRGVNNISGGELYITDINFSTLNANDYNNSHSSNKLIYFPNPVKNVLNIKTKNNSTINSVKLYDVSGREIDNNVKIKIDSNVKYNISNLESGIYLIKVTLSNNQSNTFKIIKN